MVDTVSTEGAREGSPFQAKLVSPIRDADGTELVPADATVWGRIVDAQGGGAVRRPRLEITLASIEAPRRQVPVATTSAGAEGGHGGAVRKIGAGALIGAAVGEVGAGAAIGGAAVLLSGGTARFGSMLVASRFSMCLGRSRFRRGR